MHIIEYEEFVPDLINSSHNSNINKGINTKEKLQEIDNTIKDQSKSKYNEIGSQLVSSESNKILIIDGEELANFYSTDNENLGITSSSGLSLSFSNSNTNNSNKHSNNNNSQNNQFLVQNKMNNTTTTTTTIQEVKDLPAPRNNLKKKFNFENLIIDDNQTIKLSERKVENINFPLQESSRTKGEISGLTNNNSIPNLTLISQNGESSTKLKSKLLKTKRNLELNHLEEEDNESNLLSMNPPKKYEPSIYTDKPNLEIELKELEVKLNNKESDLAKSQILLTEKDEEVRRYVNELQFLENKLEEFAKIKQIEIAKNIEALTQEYEKKIEIISQENDGLKSQLNVLNDNFNDFQQEYTDVREKFEAQVHRMYFDNPIYN